MVSVRTHSVLLLFALALSIATTSSAFASSSGITRRSTFVSGGCGPGGCHAATSVAATTVRVPEATENKITVARGQKIRLTLVVENQNRVSVGCNISVKTSLDGNTNGGTLTSVVGEGLRVSVGELTHNFPKPFVNKQVSFAFDWTAPSTDGTFFLHAAANAVNQNGSSDPNDLWNYLTPVQIVVSGTNGVLENASASNTRIAPQPAHDRTTITSNVPYDGEYVLNILNANGAILWSDVVTSGSNTIEYEWLGTDKSGNPVPSGSYPFNIVGPKAVLRGSILLVR